MKKNSKLIKNISINERPREKFDRFGAEKLTDAELLALILRTGSKNLGAVELAEHILDLDSPGIGLEKLFYISKFDLLKIKGIGNVKAIQILALSELMIRLSKIKIQPKISFSNPQSIADYYMDQFRTYRQEHLLMMLFDTKNHLLCEQLISKGSVNTSIAEPREIFREALRYGAVSIILIHNHPSGDPTPSHADIAITERIFDAGQLLGIQLLDHIIIGNRQYISMKQQQLF